MKKAWSLNLQPFNPNEFTFTYEAAHENGLLSVFSEKSR